MLNVFKARWIQGYRTGKFPPEPPKLPEYFQGRPEIKAHLPEAAYQECQNVCPTGAFTVDDQGPKLDLGKCIFCGKCANCPCHAVKFTREYRLAAFTREQLICRPGDPAFEVPRSTDEVLKKLCGKSLKIRQISAGGCAACELDFNVLSTLAWDMGRFGIKVVASPRHADCLLVTGAVTENMLLALQKSYDAMPKPGWVIACGSCAVAGGLYADAPSTLGGVEQVVKPDLYVPGCPPHPATLLEGLLRLMGQDF